MRLDNKTAVITGGSSGIGLAIADRFAAEGAKVIVLDLKKPDRNFQYFEVDIRNEESIIAAAKDIDTLNILVNIASGLGVVPESGSSAYCTSKAGVIMLTKCMAIEYASQGIRVNTILPGPIDTPLLQAAFTTDDEVEQYAKTKPLQRIGTAEEVANVALFLASDEASYVTGGQYTVDGGESVFSIYSL